MDHRGRGQQSAPLGSVAEGVVNTSASSLPPDAVRLIEREVRLLERRGQGLFVGDPMGRLIFVNPVAMDLGCFEWSDGSLARRDSWDIVRRDGQVVPHQELPRSLALRIGRTVHRMELGLRDPEGTVVWFAVTANPVKAEDGEVVAAITTLAPVDAEVVHGPGSLPVAEPQAVVAFDGSGRATFVSTEAEVLYGCVASDAMGRPAPEVVTWDLPAARIESLVAGNGRDDAWSGRIWVRRPDASCAPARLTIVPVTTPDGGQGAISIACEDVSVAHQAVTRGPAAIDELTGLSTRRSFLDALQRRCSGRRSSETPIVLVVLKLEDLRIINDVENHQTGDQVIRSAARSLMAAMHVGDTAGRMSGTSFAVCFQPEEHAVVEDYVARLRRAIELPIPVRSEHVTLRCSAGFAETADSVASADQLLQAADMALARARVLTREASFVFDEELRERLQRDQQIEAVIRSALASGEMALGYQPIVRIDDSVVVGVEALLRLQGEAGVLSALEVITVAERRGLIGDLGLLILETACRAAAAWGRPDGGPALSVSVNVSADQLDDPHLDAKVARVLAETGLEPGRLNLEMTESVLMHDSTWSVGQLTKLKRLGLRLSADDFGTGYSSLAYLKRFPLDVIKADLSFVAGLPHSLEDVAVVHAIVGLAEVLGLRVVAEGVENDEQIEALRSLGCELGQGYRWSRAVPGDEVVAVAEAIGRLIPGT